MTSCTSASVACTPFFMAGIATLIINTSITESKGADSTIASSNHLFLGPFISDEFFNYFFCGLQVCTLLEYGGCRYTPFSHKKNSLCQFFIGQQLFVAGVRHQLFDEIFETLFCL